MNVEVYSAFMSMGISEERAKAALKALDDEIMKRLDYGFNAMRADIAALNAEIAKVQGSVASIRWFIGATALMISVVLPLIIHFLK